MTTSKPEFYESLSIINDCLCLASEHMQKLADNGILPSNLAEIHVSAANLMRSEISQLATNRLNTLAADDAYRFQQQHLELEKRLNEPPIEVPPPKITSFPPGTDAKPVDPPKKKLRTATAERPARPAHPAH